MTQHPRFGSRFGGAPSGMVIATPPTEGTLLARVNGLIREARTELQAFAEGRTMFIGYLLHLRDRMQYCLADVGDPARQELRDLATMDLSISEGLARWYAQGVYNDFQVKEGDPSEFLRLQKEYDQATPPKIQGMIALLEKVRDKMLGITSAPSTTPLVRPFSTPNGSTWTDVLIRFTSDLQVQINVGDRTEVRNYVDIGFEDRRGKKSTKPDRNWEVLRRFAQFDGRIQSTEEKADWCKLEKAVQAINKRLQTLFGFPDRPIVYDRRAKSYRTTFKTSFPTANGDV